MSLSTGQRVQLTIRGRKRSSSPQVETSDYELIGAHLNAFLKAVPRDASHAGIRLDEEGKPDLANIRRVVPEMVYLRFPLEKDNG